MAVSLAEALSRPDGMVVPAMGSGRARSRWMGMSPWTVMWLAWVAGAALVTLAYNQATVSSGTGYFAVFWLGMALGVLPATVFVATKAPNRLERLSAVLGTAAFTFLPKVLLDPTQPLFHDEYAHWREVLDILRTGKLHQPNTIVPIISNYPGLHALTTVVQRMSGLSIWHSALLVLFVAHCASLIAVFLIAERLTNDLRIAAIAALAYALNSSYMYFDTQFAYESMAILLFLTAAYCGVAIWRSTSRAQVKSWLTMGVIIGAGCVVTHHLSSVFLVGLLAIMGAFIRPDAGADLELQRHARRAIWILAGVIAVFLTLWITLLAPFTMHYLGDVIGKGTSQLGQIITGKKSAGPGTGQRTLFAHNAGPIYEHLAAFASPVLAFGVALVGLRLYRRKQLFEGAARPFIVFGFLYFASLPFVLVYGGGEGAHRSWAFSYLGLAIVVAGTGVWMLDRSLAWGHRVRRALAAGLLATFAVVLVGNVAAGENTDYRFPGPYAYGSDTRSVTPELRAMSDWLKKTVGPDNLVVTDRYTGLILASLGGQQTAVPSKDFPTYDLFFNGGGPNVKLLGELQASNFEYLIVDKRTGYLHPLLGVYFEPDEPYAYSTNSPITPAKLNRYDTLPWTTKVFESDNYRIYRFDFAAYGRPVTQVGK